VDHKKQYTCALASRQLSVLGLCFLMKLDRIVRGDDGWGSQCVNSYAH